jgi:predicted transcriptional regulator
MLDNPFDILEEKNYDTIEKFIAAKLYEGEKKGDIALALGITASAISAHIKTMRTKWRTYN